MKSVTAIAMGRFHAQDQADAKARATTSKPSMQNSPSEASAEEQMRTAFENSKQYRSKLMFRRGGSVFAEDVPLSDYVDPSAQAAWVFWQEAWAAARSVHPEALSQPAPNKEST